jgi:hypothetical protein
MFPRISSPQTTRIFPVGIHQDNNPNSVNAITNFVHTIAKSAETPDQLLLTIDRMNANSATKDKLRAMVFIRDNPDAFLVR